MCVHMGDIHQYLPYCPCIIIITITIISEYILTWLAAVPTQS